MFERFDDAARAAIVTAQTEAVDLGHNYIGTEHLLLGVIADRDGVPARLTTAEGIDAELIRCRIALIVGAHRRTDRDPGRLLASLGIDLDEVRRRAESTFGADQVERVALRTARVQRGRRGPGWLRRRPDRRCAVPASPLAQQPVRMPFTPRTKRTIELAAQEADRRCQNLTPTHLLLGIFAEGQGLACLILAQAGVDLPRLAADARATLDPTPPPDQDPAA